MSEWSETPDPQDGPSTPPFVMVTTSSAVSISVREVLDERTPEDAVCLGTFYEGRLIARCVVPPEALVAVEDHALFTDPVHLGLLGFEEPPGLQCRLLAFVDSDRLPPDLDSEDEVEEPWQASVPRPEFEFGAENTEAPALGEPEGTVPILLGHIVRMARDRKHPDDMAHEAMDVLATILTGTVSEVVDRVLQDLLGDETGETDQEPDPPDEGAEEGEDEGEKEE